MERRERVGCLARLGDRDQEGIGQRDRIAVAVLAGDFDRARNPGNTLDPVACDQSCVIARSTGQNLNLAGAGKALRRIGPEKFGGERASRRDHLERAGNRPGLLEDFLLHVVIVGPEFYRIGAQLAQHHRALDRPPRCVLDADAPGTNLNDIAVFQVRNLARHLQERGGIGGQKILATPGLILANPQQERRAFSGTNNGLGLRGTDDGDRVRTDKLPDRSGHSAQERARRTRTLRRLSPHEQGMNQVRDDFRIGFAGELVPEGFQTGPQHLVVLNDAVMNDRHFKAGAGRGMRMRVGFGHPAVGCPPRVGDPGHCASAHLQRGPGIELGHTPDRAHPPQVR